MPFTPFTRDSHKRVLSFVSLSKEKHFKERYSAKKTSGRFFENLYKKSENLYKKLKSLAGSDVKYRNRICGMLFGLRITFRFQ